MTVKKTVKKPIPQDRLLALSAFISALGKAKVTLFTCDEFEVAFCEPDEWEEDEDDDDDKEPDDAPKPLPFKLKMAVGECS